MGRLNYTNRKSEGLKLAQIVAKDLRKRTTQFLAKPTETASLELNLHGKNLRDEGLEEICSALLDALSVDVDGVCCYKLEELDLSGNAISYRSLRSLGFVIAAACFDLKDLDLSENQIGVLNDDEAEEWYGFLDQFKDCRVLRRIDLSGNKLSNPRAFEIFVRVYAKHLPVDPTELRDSAVYDTLPKATETEMSGLVKRVRSMSMKEHSMFHSSPAALSLSNSLILQRRRGLRSVPYIIISNCEVTDSGALFLSYILANHYYPQQLLCPLKTGSAALQVDEDNQVSHSWGLVYLPNEKLTSWGRRLLENAEAVRQELLGISEQASPGSFASSYEMVTATQSNPIQRRQRTSSDTHRRRSSTLSSGIGGSGDYLNSTTSIIEELESFRRKIQRHTIEMLGVPQVQLWSAAIKTLWYTRVILCKRASTASPVHRAEYGQVDSDLIRAGQAPPEAGPSTGIAMSSTAEVTKKAIDAHVIDFTQRHAINRSLLRFSLLQPPQPETEWKIGIRKSRTTPMELDPSLPYKLPLRIWQRIIALAADPHGILSEDQQHRVTAWGRDRNSLAVERETLGKPESVQIWKVLEGLGCLAYEIRT